jgi:hypothetical protein
VSRKAVLDLLEGAARYLDELDTGSGERVCHKHGVEHLGKTAYRIHMGLALAKNRGADLRVVRETALHLAKRCRKYPHPEARAYLFFERWPDKWNCSNHLIDSGAACDALGRALIEAPEIFDDEQRELVEDALGKCAETYLWAAAVDKPVPAQCLWAALGMARASVALNRDDLAERARAAIQHAYLPQRPDGSWSYYPSGGEAGSDDASAFYHSRCIGFALETLDLIGDDPCEEPHRGNLTRALDFLLALHRVDDTKCRAWEAKLWYFDGPAEVASNSFDVHALVLGQRAFRDNRYAARAKQSLESLIAAQGSDGSIQSGAVESFQCSTFWTAHTGLLSSVLDEFDELDLIADATVALRSVLFEDAGLGRLVSGSRIVLVRGNRSSSSPGFGGIRGGGAIVSDSSLAKGERIEHATLRSDEVGEFRMPARGLRFTSDASRLKTALVWLRFSRWRWRCELRASGMSAAIHLAARTIREVLRWCRTDVASHFASDARMTLHESTLRIESQLASIDGKPLVGTRTERRVELTSQALVVEDIVTSDKPWARMDYRLPVGAIEVTCNQSPIANEYATTQNQTRMEVRYKIP